MTEYRSEVRDQKRAEWDVPIPMHEGMVLSAASLGPPGPHPWQLRGLRRRLLGETGRVLNVGERDAC
jgi:hypothetical protein